MRSLALSLLLSVPLLAGGRDVLADLAQRFASDRPDERDSASQAVRRLLERQLAPLLAAMRSDDPEVARRAREVIASLLPDRPAADTTAAADSGQVQAVFVNNVQGQIRFVVRRGQRGVMVVPQRLAGARDARLTRLGLEGYPLADPLLRKHLRVAEGRGFVLRKVTRDSLAAKFGFRADDIVLRVNGRRVMQLDEIATALGTMERKDLAARVLREGKLVDLSWPEPR